MITKNPKRYKKVSGFSLSFFMNKTTSTKDYNLCQLMLPVNLVYLIQDTDELLNFLNCNTEFN